LPPAPAPPEAAKAEPQLPPAPAHAPAAVPAEAVKAEPQLPPAPASAEAAKSEPQLPPAPAPAPVPAQTVKAEPQPPPAPAPVPAETVKAEPQPAIDHPISDIQVATTQPQAPPEPAAGPGPPAAAPQPTTAPQPEGPPDLQGRVTGAKGLNEIEVDKTHWIRIYGIVDRARGAQEAQHTEALVRYLKPSHNQVVCYRKAADLYRCYADGQDIARLALVDRLVQLAPNAPSEYRSLLAPRR
jgi:hypothetical protein